MLPTEQCSRSVVAPNSASTLRGVLACCAPGPKRVRLEGPFDQPACVEVSQSVVVVDRHRAGPARAILFRQIFPHVGD